MSRGKKQPGKSQRSAPISSLASATATEETLSLLSGAGLSSFQGSEAEAMALLAVRGDDNPAEFAPACFRRDYDPGSELCGGCVFAASCWVGDNRYLLALRAGKSANPPHVPDSVVEAVTTKQKPRPAPPKPRRRK